MASIESHLDDDDQDLVRDARKDLLRYVTAGDPPQIKMEAPTKAASGDFTLAELLGTWKNAYCLLRQGPRQPGIWREAPAEVRRSMLLWVGCIAGASRGHAFRDRAAGHGHLGPSQSSRALSREAFGPRMTESSSP